MFQNRDNTLYKIFKELGRMQVEGQEEERQKKKNVKLKKNRERKKLSIDMLAQKL